MWLMHSDFHRRALVLAGARAKYGPDSAEAQAIVTEIREAMKWNLNFATSSQQHWGARVSRRPLRGNHYDSWGMREKYVTCRSEYSPRHKQALDYATSLAITAGRPTHWHRSAL